MKTSHLVLLSLILILSCKKESDPEPDPAVSIIGSWTVNSEVNTECTIPGNNSSETYSCSAYCIKYTFASSGSYTVQEIENNNNVVDQVSGTYSIADDHLIIGTLAVYSFVVKGSTMTWVGPYDGCTLTTVLSKD